MLKKWKQKKSEFVLRTKWINVRKDMVELPNGVTIEDFYVVSTNDASAIVALDENENLILKEEYRYSYDKNLIEIPAGGFEMSESDGLEVAKRELLEETGYISDEWIYLGKTIDSSSKLTNYMHLYFANKCRRVCEQRLDETEALEVRIVPFQKALDMIMSNEICCNSSAHAILKVARILGK